MGVLGAKRRGATRTPSPRGDLGPNTGYGQQFQPFAPGSQPFYPQAPMPHQPVMPVVAIAAKSNAVAGLLAFFFGPIGMLYSTWVGALVMFGVNLVVALIAFVTFGFGALLWIPVTVAEIIWAVQATNEYNRRLGVVTVAPMTYR